MCGDEVFTQNLEETIDDDENSLEVKNQAILLLQLGFKGSDYFCQECYWK